MTNFIEEQQKEDWQPAKWVLEPTDPLLNWKKGWNEGGDAAVTAFTQHILESGLLEEKDVSGEFLCDLVYRMPPQDGDTVTHTHVDYSARKGHNTLARAVKELISKMNSV